jgi:hypothetical protein
VYWLRAVLYGWVFVLREVGAICKRAFYTKRDGADICRMIVVRSEMEKEWVGGE